jgi:hypothetical protein
MYLTFESHLLRQELLLRSVLNGHVAGVHGEPRLG